MGCFAWICLMQFILFYSLCLYSFVKHWEPNSTLPAQINILVSSLITPKKTILFNCSVCHLLYKCNCFRATHKYLCKLRKDGIIWTWGSCISIRVVAASQNYICARNRSKCQIMREVVISERINLLSQIISIDELIQFRKTIWMILSLLRLIWFSRLIYSIIWSQLLTADWTAISI